MNLYDDLDDWCWEGDELPGEDSEESMDDSEDRSNTSGDSNGKTLPYDGWIHGQLLLICIYMYKSSMLVDEHLKSFYCICPGTSCMHACGLVRISNGWIYKCNILVSIWDTHTHTHTHTYSKLLVCKWQWMLLYRIQILKWLHETKNFIWIVFIYVIMLTRRPHLIGRTHGSKSTATWWAIIAQCFTL